MQKEDVMVLAHLFTAMKEAIEKLEESQRRNDVAGILAAKKEINSLQGQVKKLL